MKLGPFTFFEKRASPENPSTNLADPATWLVGIFGGNETASGIHVTSESVLSTAVGWRCVNLISETIASLPLAIYRSSDDSREVMKNSPLMQMLHSRPNPTLTSYRWRRLFMKQLLLNGRSYTRIERNAGGRPTGLFPLDPRKVTVKRKNGSVFYEVALSNGSPEILPSDEVLHFTGMDTDDGLDGISPTEQLKNTFGLSIALETYASAFFRNGARPGLMMEYPVGRNLSPDAIERIRKSVEDTHGEVGKSHKVMILEDGVKVHKVTVDPKESQFDETRELQRKEMANVFNVPAFFLGDSDPAKANSEQQALFFVKHTIRPWLVMLEQEMNLKLLTASQARNQNIEHNVEGILRGDLKARMDAYAAGIQNSILKPNEARRRENLPDDPAGDQLVIQQNMSQLGIMGQPAAPEPQQMDLELEPENDED